MHCANQRAVEYHQTLFVCYFNVATIANGENTVEKIIALGK